MYMYMYIYIYMHIVVIMITRWKCDFEKRDLQRGAICWSITLRWDNGHAGGVG